MHPALQLQPAMANLSIEDAPVLGKAFLVLKFAKHAGEL